jgi:hypothetical protein
MGARSGLYALACLFGVLLILAAGFGAAVVLAVQSCDTAFAYDGCETPTAKVRHEGDQFAQIAPADAVGPR